MNSQPLVKVRKVLSSLVFRAFLFSLILNLSYIFEYFDSDGFSHLLFSDWDEPVYLGMLKEMSSHNLSILLDFSKGIPVEYPLPFFYPHVAVDLFLSRIIYLFNLTPIDIGLGLDLVCSFLGFIIFSKFFGLFTAKTSLAQLIAIGFLCFPGSLNIGESLGLDYQLSKSIAAAAPHTYICLTILRSAYTQLGLLAFGLNLIWFINYLQSPSSRICRLGFLGFSVGLTIYLYFFVWGALMGLCCLVLTCRLLPHNLAILTRLLIMAKEIALFVSCSFMAAGPGLYLSTLSTTKELLALPPELQGYWYFPFDILLLFLLTLVLFFSGSSNQKKMLCLIIMTSCLLAELILNNIQTVLGQLLTPYHFTIFYLRSLFFGFVLLIFMQMRFHRIVLIACYGAILGGALVPSYKLSVERFLNKPAETIELIQFLNSRKGVFDSSKTLWVYPHKLSAESALEKKSLPYWISATTNLQVKFSTIRREDLEVVNSVADELILNWLYFNTPKLISGCEYSAVPVPGDLFIGVGTWSNLRRLVFCSESQELREQFDACQSVKNQTIDYFLWEPNRIVLKPDWLSSSAVKTWESSAGQYQLFKINQESLVKNVCGNSSSI